MRTLGFLRRNMNKCPQDIKTVCYNALVRPILEYASCVWDPNTKENVAKVESVQRCAARYVKNDFSKESMYRCFVERSKWDTLTASPLHGEGYNDVQDYQQPTFYIPKTRSSLLRGGGGGGEHFSQTPSVYGIPCPGCHQLNLSRHLQGENKRCRL